MTRHISAEEISAYLDAEEAETPAAEIEEHLSRCPDCSKERDHLRLVKRLVARSAEIHSASWELAERAFARIERESAAPPPRRAWRMAMVPAFAALFIVAVIVVGNVYLTPEGWRISCAECQELLPEYIAHSLPSGQTHLVSAHLDVCPACHEVYDRMLAEAHVALLERDDWPSPADLPLPRAKVRPGRRVAWVREEPPSI